MPTDSPPPSPDRDPRPRPRYGELAPDGWSWSPLGDQLRSPSPGSAPVATPNRKGPVPAGGIPAWDRPLTLALLVFGLVATFVAVMVLNTLPDALQLLYTRQDLGRYSPAGPVAGLILSGSITEGVIWLVSASLSILLMVRGRRAFYLPLIGAVVSFVLIFVFMGIILATDPTLLGFYSQP